MKYVHTNIVARDWKALAEFYIRVFSCKEKPPERHLSGDWLDNATGLTRASLNGIHLILPGYGDNGPTLEIFSYDTMVDNGTGQANTIGFSHIAFLVEDVTQTYQTALDHGAVKLGQITKKQVDGVGHLTLVYLRDPEGNIVEIQSWS